MANVEGAYCAETDLRTGDIAIPSSRSAVQYIQGAAEEIDAALGHLYVTPFAILDLPENRPSILFIKKINWLLASARFLLDVAAAGENDSIHALGRQYLREATEMLELVSSGKLVLTGADLIGSDDESSGNYTGPFIHNEDSASLVESFYDRFRPQPTYGVPQVTPYG